VAVEKRNISGVSERILHIYPQALVAFKKYMPHPLPYFKVNICPFPLPHFAGKSITCLHDDSYKLPLN
jgi:hypothetical protein